jgi:hypothetical protein
MTILGTASYAQGPGYAFPRPYVAGIRFRFGPSVTFTHSDNEFIATDSLHPWVHVICNWYENFWEWHNNGYTIDHILTDWWLILDPDPTPQALNYGMGFEFRPTTLDYVVAIGVLGGTIEYDFPLPPAPSDYWLYNPS